MGERNWGQLTKELYKRSDNGLEIFGIILKIMKEQQRPFDHIDASAGSLCSAFESGESMANIAIGSLDGKS